MFYHMDNRALHAFILNTIVLLCAVASKEQNSATCKANDCGAPLLLTPYIESGALSAAREASRVNLDGSNITSYSGFLEIDKAAGSNLFFWFFQKHNHTAKSPPPLILWLQGGPGSSGLFGLFVEIGPYAVDASRSKLLPRVTSWTREAAILFVDSPVGTGFSFTDDYQAFARDETQIAEGLLAMLRQFFVLFPTYSESDFYIFGESYGGGKYAPALAGRISRFNKDVQHQGKDQARRMGLHHINLKALGLGDPGVADPAAQLPLYADELYNMGLVDPSQRERIRAVMDKALELTEAGRYGQAFAKWDSVWGDVGDERFPSLFTNYTFSTYTLNAAFSSPPPEFDYYVGWVDTPTVRKAIHVGSLPFGLNASRVYNTLAYEAGEFMGETLTHTMVQLLSEYHVVVYSGSLDPLLGAVLTDAWISKILHLRSEQSARDFAATPKVAWHIGRKSLQLVGYVREMDNLTLLTLRNSGHLVPYDQPAAALDMVRRVVHGMSFTAPGLNVEPLVLGSDLNMSLVSLFAYVLAVALVPCAIFMGMVRMRLSRIHSKAPLKPLLSENVESEATATVWT